MKLDKSYKNFITELEQKIYSIKSKVVKIENLRTLIFILNKKKEIVI